MGQMAKDGDSSKPARPDPNPPKKAPQKPLKRDRVYDDDRSRVNYLVPKPIPPKEPKPSDSGSQPSNQGKKEPTE